MMRDETAVSVGPGSGLAYGGPGRPAAVLTEARPAAVVVPVATRRLLLAWLGLALGSLVIAGFFAMLAALARTPAVQILPSAELFQLALTSHVTFAFTVWFVTFAGALWIYVAWRANYRVSTPASWVAVALATAGSTAMAVPAFLASGRAYLNDYLPVIDHPFFWWGLLLVTVGVSVQAASYLAAAARARAERRAGTAPTGSPEATAMAVGAVSMLLATVSVAVAWVRLDPGLHFGYSLRALFWGGGHILQFLHVVGMVSAWVVCLSVALAAVFPALRVLRLLLTVLVPFMVAAAGTYLVWRPEELLINHLVTILSFGGLGVAGVPMLLMGAVTVAVARRPLPWRSPLFSATVVSFAMFGLGGVMGLIGFSQDTRVPAHYHGMVGAVTLAYMGLMPLLLDVCGRKPWSDRLSRWQPYLYGLGLLGLMIGMHWAGGHGAPRKTIGFTWANATAIIAMNVMGVGSLLAILGGLAFVVNMTVPLCQRRPRG